MKKKTLNARAKNFAVRWGLDEVGAESHGIAKGWLAGYKAAQKDEYAKTYSREFCKYCSQPKDGHKHKFCKHCKRIKEHCKCGII
jgi:hypothetical protein